MKLMQIAVASSNDTVSQSWAGADNPVELEKVAFTENFAAAVEHR